MYKRIVLKLSGETLGPLEDKLHKGYDAGRVEAAAKMLMGVAADGTQLVVILGGGNLWRGRFGEGMNPVNADQMGMLATIMNALCVQDAITGLGGKAKVFTAQEMNRFADLYTRERANEALENGNIVFIAGGSGNPFFTTDTAAALRAAELGADVVFKGTNVEGIYDRNPKEPGAVLLSEITYDEAIEKGLQIMDTTAFVLCRNQHIPAIRVFNMDKLENIIIAARGGSIGTVAHE